MSSVMSIATSGMAAATRRLEVSARNVANVRSAGPLPSAGAAVTASFGAPFTPWRVDQVEVAGGGTAAQVSAVNPGQVPAHDPGAPYADQNGMVAAPNVDLEGEVVEALVARYSFALNAKVMRTSADMTKSLLDITA
jgi:flagellar basal-body rod protein FlgC